MVWTAIVLFGVVGIVLILTRREMARWQAILAGGTVTPGCAVVEGIVFLLLAIGFYWAHRTGIF